MHQHKEQTLHLDREKHRSTTFSPYRQADIRKLYGGRCTFCGEPLDPGVAFCTECGNAVEGITCPRCGTVSHRSFCSNCNYPLNEQAQEAVAEAKADPHFRRAEHLARRIVHAFLLQPRGACRLCRTVHRCSGTHSKPHSGAPCESRSCVCGRTRSRNPS